MLPKHIKDVIAGASLTVMLVLVLCVTADARLPSLLTEDGFYVRPAVVGYTGDGTGYLGGRNGSPANREFGTFHWRYWHRRQAAGTGVDWINDCERGCAGGSFHPRRATATAYRVRRGHFTRLRIRFRYRGHRVTDVRGLNSYGSYYGWEIIRQVGFASARVAV